MQLMTAANCIKINCDHLLKLKKRKYSFIHYLKQVFAFICIWAVLYFLLMLLNLRFLLLTTGTNMFLLIFCNVTLFFTFNSIQGFTILS